MAAPEYPSVSVIIAVRNEEAAIRQCLESVYATRYPNLEVIVVDDCSGDVSADAASKFPCKIVKLEKQMGSAFARNRGAEEAGGEILFFTDADVRLHEKTLEMIVGEFESKPELSAVFGSYGKDVVGSNFFSDYKNLVHHYGHQTAREQASTFWSGCGAIKKAVFDEAGGFNPKQRMLYDIELGYRLSKLGHCIHLNKNIQVTHSKEYTFLSLVKSDVLDRAIPWTGLMFANRVFHNDMSTSTGNILSTIVAYLALFALISTAFSWYSLLIFAFLAAFFLALNIPFYSFIYQERGALFTIKSLLMHYLSCLYSGTGLIAGVVLYITGAVLRRAASI